MDMKKLFGKRLKSLRLTAGEEQSELAEVVGVGTSMVSQWETGRHYPEVSKLIDICAHYGVTVDYILGLSE